jgi:DNA-directed RNA polymerase subunit omega
MARITVEDCLVNVNNRFGLIHLAAKRVRQLRKGAEPLVVCKNKDIVVSLREIAAGKVFPVNREDENSRIEAIREPISEELPEQTAEESPDEVQGDQEAMPEEE